MLVFSAIVKLTTHFAGEPGVVTVPKFSLSGLNVAVLHDRVRFRVMFRVRVSRVSRVRENFSFISSLKIAENEG